MTDEIITELYAIKDAIAEEFNYDLDLLFEDLKRSEIEHRARGGKFANLPTAKVSLPLQLKR